MANWISSKLKAAESILQQVNSPFLTLPFLFLLVVLFLRLFWEAVREFDFLFLVRSLRICRSGMRCGFLFLKNRAAHYCIGGVIYVYVNA